MSKLQIAMSDRPPVEIDTDEWEVIAEAAEHDGQVYNQSNERYEIAVRQHTDGRRIVHGDYDTNWTTRHNCSAGFLLDADAGEQETIRAIRRVAGAIDNSRLGDECIQDLPAEVI